MQSTSTIYGKSRIGRAKRLWRWNLSLFRPEPFESDMRFQICYKEILINDITMRRCTGILMNKQASTMTFFIQPMIPNVHKETPMEYLHLWKVLIQMYYMTFLEQAGFKNFRHFFFTYDKWYGHPRVLGDESNKSTFIW